MLIILSSINIFIIVLIKLLNVKNNIKIKILYEIFTFSIGNFNYLFISFKKEFIKIKNK